jgi:hypothetical protein
MDFVTISEDANFGGTGSSSTWVTASPSARAT